jgi:hypothetical protein
MRWSQLLSSVAELWPQTYVWSFCFFVWYQLYATAFLPIVFNGPGYITPILYVPFALVSSSSNSITSFKIWLLTVSSLYKCVYTHAPLIPTVYRVPNNIFRLLPPRDKKDFQSSETNISISSSSSSSDSDASSIDLSRRSKQSKWEKFYRRLASMAVEERNLDVRTM